MFGEMKMSLKVSPLKITKGKTWQVAAAAQTIPSTDLNPEITDFCSRLNITPAIQEFPDENESGPELCVSNKSSDIEEEQGVTRVNRGYFVFVM